MDIKRLRGLCGTVASVSASLLLLGCGTSNTNVRTVNASPGLTGYTIQVGLIPVASNVPYGTEGVQPKGQYSTIDASGNYRQVGAGTNQTVSLYQTPGTSIATATHSLLKNGYYTIANLGAPGSIALVVLPDGNTAPTSGDFELRLVDASQISGPVDVYLTAQGAGISGSPVASGMQFGQSSQQYLEVPASTGEVQITPAGNSSKVLFVGTFTPSSGSIYTGYFLDPNPSTPSSYGFLLVKDPVLTATPKG